MLRSRWGPTAMQRASSDRGASALSTATLSPRETPSSQMISNKRCVSAAVVPTNRCPRGNEAGHVKLAVACKKDANGGGTWSAPVAARMAAGVSWSARSASRDGPDEPRVGGADTDAGVDAEGAGDAKDGPRVHALAAPMLA